MNRIVALCVFTYFAGHGPNYSYFINHFSGFRKNGTNRNSTLSMPGEGVRRGENIPIVVELSTLNFEWQRIAGIFLEHRLWIKGVDVRDASRHVAENNAFCSWSMMRFRTELILVQECM